MGNARTYRRCLLYSACLLGLVTALLGCCRTEVGGFDDSPDKKYRMFGKVFGAPGRAYVDNTRKTVRISIYTNDEKITLLFRKAYRVKGSDVGWDATWDEHNNIAVVIFDYGPGVLFTGLKKDEPPKRYIRTMVYHLDSTTGTFTEEPAGSRKRANPNL